MGDSSFAHPRRNIEALDIQAGMKVADFGSGSGAYALAIAKALRGSGTIYAVDVQKDLLRRIRNEATAQSLEVEVVWGDVEEKGGSKLANNGLDCVLISNLLFQVRAREAVLAEAERITRPSGRVVIIDWSESYGGMGPSPDAVCKKEEALMLARDTGLVFVKEFDAGAHHYGLIFRKNAIATPRA